MKGTPIAIDCVEEVAFSQTFSDHRIADTVIIKNVPVKWIKQGKATGKKYCCEEHPVSVEKSHALRK